MVYGPYSSPRGQALVVQDTTYAGLELCVPDKADACVRLASRYDGPMHRVAAAPLGLSSNARANWNIVAVFWLLLGVMAMVFMAAAREADEENAPEDPQQGQ